MKNQSLFKFDRLFIKKVLCLFLFVLFMNTVTNAQVLSVVNPTRKSKVLPKLYAGAKFGTNFSYLSGDSWTNGIKSNLIGGAFAGLKGMGFGVQMEGLFEQSEYTTGNSFYDVYKSHYNNIGDSLRAGTFRVNKLSLPVLLQFRMARLFWLQAGVQFYGIVSVKDFNGLVRDAKQLFRGGNTAGIIGTTIRLGNADIGARAIFDFQNLNNQNSSDVWKQYLIQAHVGVTLF